MYITCSRLAPNKRYSEKHQPDNQVSPLDELLYSDDLLCVLVLYLGLSPRVPNSIQQLSSHRALAKLPQPAQ